MEEQKKKFLLSRIKRQQLAIKNSYNQFNTLFISKNIKKQNFVSYIEHIKHLMNNNNTFALNLCQYLQKQQIETVFQRINNIFQDLLDKFKTKHRDYIDLENINNSKEIRQICQVCHEQLQKNRISSIQQDINNDNECKVTLLKKLIEQSKRQQKIPLFTYEQDKLFKQNLQKIFEDKERLLFTSWRQSDNFIEVVEKQMTSFMIDFRKQLAQYQKNKIQQKQTQNWGKMMKLFLNKKLTNSFQNKMPSWIKKMQTIFMNKISLIPKPQTLQKSIQTNQNKTDKQIREQQIKDLKQKIKMKNININKFQDQMMKIKIQNQFLKGEIQRINAEMIAKMVSLTIKSKKNIEFNGQNDEIRQGGSKHKNAKRRTQISNEQQGKQTKQIQKQNQKQDNDDFLSQIKRMKKKKLKAMQLGISKMRQLDNSINKTYTQLDIIQNDMSSISQIDHIQQNKPKDQSKTINIKNKSSIVSDENSGSTARLKKKVYKRQNYQNYELPLGKEQIESKRKGRADKQKLNKSKEQLAKDKSLLKTQVRQVSRHLQKDIQYFNNIRHSQVRKQRTKKDEASYIKSLPQNTYKQSIQLTEQNEILITKVQNLNPTSQHHKKSLQNAKKLSQFNETLQKLLNMQIINDTLQQNKKGKLFRLIEEYIQTSQKVRHNLQKQFSLPKIKPSVHNLQYNKILDDLKDKTHQKMKYAVKLHKSMHANSEKLSRSDKSKLQNKNGCLIKFPIINQACNNHLKTIQNENSIFVPDIVCLFMNNDIAQQYENDHSAKHVVKPTPSQFQKIQHIYSIFEGLNRNNPDIYHQICSFVKQPYTVLKNKHYKIFDYKDKIQFSTFCNNFMKIMWLHSNCKNHGDNMFCRHIQKFTQKLNSIMLQQHLPNNHMPIIDRHLKVNKNDVKDKQNIINNT